MKKIAFLFILISGILLLETCKKPETGPILDMSQAVLPTITEPADGSSIVLTKDNADSVISFVWTPAEYNLSDIAATFYSLQMVTADSSFEGAMELASTNETSYETTVGSLNNTLLNMGLEGGTANALDFRVSAFLKSYEDGAIIAGSELNSEVNTSSVTPYADIVIIKPIYLLGNGTTVGWDNTAALPMAWLGDGRFGRVESIVGGSGQYIKFISMLGFWAPQWGTDDTGLPEGGPLVYRPTEDVPDPPAIQVADADGNYYIEADTALLTYKTFLTSGELYLVGDATDAGWDNTNGIAFVEDSAHIFTLTTNLKAEGGMKFLEISGEWAPQWGTTESGTSTTGMLVYRPDEITTDPVNIPAPASAGSYKIIVNLNTLTYTIEAQ